MSTNGSNFELAPKPPAGSDDDEESFVVLDTNGFASSDFAPPSSNSEVFVPLRTHKVHEVQKSLQEAIAQIDSEQTSTVDPTVATVSKITISPDSSHEEIQKQVEDIIRENEALKNVIAQNNISMKSQYNKFVGYKDDVTNVMGSYKEKFNEAKVCIEKLKEENIKLASELEVHVNLKKLHEEEILNLKGRGANMNLVDSTDTDLKNELAEAKQKLAKIDTQNETEIICLKKQVTDLNKQLTEQEEELNLKKKEQNKLQTQIEDGTLKFQQQLDLKQAEIDKLMKLMNAPKNDVESKQQEINVLQFDLSNLKIELDKLKKEKKDLAMKKDALEHQEDKRDELLMAKNLEISALRQKLQDNSQQLTSLTQKLQEMQLLSNIRDECTQTRKQLSVAQQTITALETEREDKANEIEKLKKFIQETNDKDNEIFVLNEQLNLFKADFEAEKNENGNLRAKQQQLSQDLQNSHKRVKQLENELEVHIARSQPRTDGFTCPKCSFSFTSYQALENHVHRCLDLEESLP